MEVNDVDGIICVTPKKEINNVCETDIGSPLACQNENGFYELAGIYSRNTGCLPTNQVRRSISIILLGIVHYSIF